MLVMDIAKEIVDVMSRLVTLATGRPCVHSIYATYSLKLTTVCVKSEESNTLELLDLSTSFGALIEY